MKHKIFQNNTIEANPVAREPHSQSGSLTQALLKLFVFRFYVPAIIILLALSGLCGYMYVSMVQREQIQITQTIAAQTDAYLASASRSLNALTTITEEDHSRAIKDLFQIQPYFDSFYLLDQNGNILESSADSTAQAAIELSNQGLAKIDTPTTDNIQISQPFVSSRTGLLTVFFSKSLSNGKHLVAELNLAELQQFIRASQPAAQQEMVYFIADLDGTLLANSVSDQAAQQASLSYFNKWHSALSWPDYRQIINKENLAIETQSPLKNANWLISTEFPLRPLFASYLWVIFVILTIFLIFWGMMTYKFNHRGIQRIIAPLTELSQYTNQLTEGENAPPAALAPSLSPYSEVHNLAMNFEKMRTNLQLRQLAIQESEQKYHMLIDQSSDAIYVEYRGRFVITNQKFNEMFGIGRDDKEITSIGFIQFVLPASRPLVKDIQRQISDGKSDHLRYEFSARTKDGREIELEASTSALPYSDGMAIQSIVRDITERKRTEQAEREQRILAEALRDSVSALNNTLEVDEVIDRIFSNASKVVPFQAATIMLLEGTGKRQAHIVASFGYHQHGEQERAQKQSFSLSEYQNLKRMFDSGQPLVISDTLHSPYRTASPEIRWVRSYAGAPIRVQGNVIGFLNLEVDIPNYYNQTHADRLQAFADQAGVAIHNAQLLTDLRKSRDELYDSYETTLEGWSKALELRDYETEGHTQRVMDMTMKLAESYGITGSDLLHIRYGTLLHDIGKIGIPDSILFKPGPLDEEEWVVMRRHPVYAKRILAHIPYLQDSLEIPYSHHEKWDGTGYPNGLKGEEIPLAARLFAVVDVWDGLRSNRHYRSGWPEADVVQYIREQSGKHFDPQVVEVFLKLLEKQNRITCPQ